MHPAGETVFEADGAQWRLRFDLNALCHVEDRLGASLDALQARLAQPGARDLRALLWAGLQRHHPEVTLEQAGRLCDVAQAGEAVGRALAAAFPREDAPGNGVAPAETG